MSSAASSFPTSIDVLNYAYDPDYGRGNVPPISAGFGDTGKTTPYTVGATVTAPTAAAATFLYCN